MSDSNLKKLTLFRPVAKDFGISSPFGLRVHPITGIEKNHNGIDFSTPVGTPITPVWPGRVVKAGWEKSLEDYPETYQKKGFGLRVWQEITFESEQYFVWYGHLSEVFVKAGEWIPDKQILGLTGNSGTSSGPHLHCGVRKKDTSDFYDMRFINMEPPNDRTV